MGFGKPGKLTHRKRKHTPTTGLPVGRPPLEQPSVKQFESREGLARALWAGDYRPLLLQQLEEFPALRNELMGFLDAHSSQRAKAKRGEAAQQEEESRELVVANIIAILSNKASQRSNNFLIAARSISSFSVKSVKVREWQAEQSAFRSRKDKDTVKSLCRLMMADSIKPIDLDDSPQFLFSCIDQCHFYEGMNTTALRKRGQERVNEDGSHHGVSGRVCVNWYTHAIPDVNPHRFTPEESAWIAEHGVYCRDFHEILPQYQYDGVQEDLQLLLQQCLDIVRVAHASEGCDTMLDASLMLVNRPAHQPHKCELDIQACIPECNTNTHYDLQRIHKAVTAKKPNAQAYLDTSDG
jgi:hypothetical protein